MVMLPASILSAYTEKISDSPELISNMYHSVKASQREGFASLVGKTYEFSFHDFFKWMTDIFAFAGWGIVEWKVLDENKHIGVITVAHAPVADELKGKVKTPIDHLIRGFVAGAASASFNVDIDVIELECAALGAPVCKFEFRPVGQFQPSPEAQRQLGK